MGFSGEGGGGDKEAWCRLLVPAVKRSFLRKIPPNPFLPCVRSAMLQMPLLTTDRLQVRPLALSDLRALHALFGDGTETERDERDAWLCWTVASYRQYARLYQPPYGERAVVLRETGELVGVAGLVPSLGPFGRLPGMGRDQLSEEERARFRAEMGLYWHVHPAHRGQGLATEAGAALIRYVLDGLQLRRVIATTEHENRASQGVMRKLGMRLERNPDPEPAWLQVVGVLEALAGSGLEA